MKEYRFEFHIHTVLSPCASVEMIPPLIVKTALENDVDVIAITDHNSIQNVESVISAAENSDLHVLAGVELHTREDIHVLCIFDHYSQLADFMKNIEPFQNNMPNNPDIFGEQFIVDHTGEFIRREKNHLLSATSISIQEANELVIEHGGLFIPSHIERQMFGLLPTLGFVPTDLKIDALEISARSNINDIINNFPEIGNRPLIKNGDAHYLSDILGLTKLKINEVSVKEIKKAFKREGNHDYCIKEGNKCNSGFDNSLVLR